MKSRNRSNPTLKEIYIPQMVQWGYDLYEKIPEPKSKHVRSKAALIHDLEAEAQFAIEVFKRRKLITWYLSQVRRLYKKKLYSVGFLSVPGPGLGEPHLVRHIMSMAEIFRIKEILEPKENFLKKTPWGNWLMWANALIEEKAKKDGPREIIQRGTAVLDGCDGRKWYLVEEEFCEATGRSMGHCGNRDLARLGDRVLNLGTPRGRVGYVPHLTFILNGGVLGEMKGPYNSKPQARFHCDIVELLESSLVSHVRGGFYKPENDFQLEDLGAEDLERLRSEKPELFSLEAALKRRDAADIWHGVFGVDHNYALPSVTRYENLEHFIRTEFGKGSQARRAFDILNDGFYEVLMSASFKDQDIINFLNLLDEKDYEWLLKKLNQKGKFPHELVKELTSDQRGVFHQAILDGWTEGSYSLLDQSFENLLSELEGSLPEGFEYSRELSRHFEFEKKHPETLAIKLLFQPEVFARLYDQDREKFRNDRWSLTWDLNFGDTQADFEFPDELCFSEAAVFEYLKENL